jgi:hypothetical protein
MLFNQRNELNLIFKEFETQKTDVKQTDQFSSIDFENINGISYNITSAYELLKKIKGKIP